VIKVGGKTTTGGAHEDNNEYNSHINQITASIHHRDSSSSLMKKVVRGAAVQQHENEYDDVDSLSGYEIESKQILIRHDDESFSESVVLSPSSRMPADSAGLMRTSQLDYRAEYDLMFDANEKRPATPLLLAPLASPQQLLDSTTFNDETFSVVASHSDRINDSERTAADTATSTSGLGGSNNNGNNKRPGFDCHNHRYNHTNRQHRGGDDNTTMYSEHSITYTAF
jgi:hypothetical protein